MKIGILSVQGDSDEHCNALKAIHVDIQLVRLSKHLDNIDGLIIPGGESTSISRLMDFYNLRIPLQEKISEGMPIWGTCAGLVLMASNLETSYPKPLNVFDITVNRNGYGSQIYSFETDLPVQGFNPQEKIHAIFIRAPVIKSIGPKVIVLGELSTGTPVVIQQGFHLGTTFHPELTADLRLHKLFVELIKKSKT